MAANPQEVQKAIELLNSAFKRFGILDRIDITKQDKATNLTLTKKLSPYTKEMDFDAATPYRDATFTLCRHYREQGRKQAALSSIPSNSGNYAADVSAKATTKSKPAF